MENIFQILSTVPDHRRGNHLIYPIDYLLLISFSGIMSGFTTWSDFELYAQLHEEDLKMLYKRLAKRELMNYTPSHDTFSYCFRGLDPKAFQEAFKSWLLTVYEILGEHICIDGKTIRGVRKLDPDSDSHTVTAYIAGIRASLNQVFISKKSNEINAVKELLDVIDVEGNILTIDAIGTQKEIVDKIVSKKGEYILQVKSNQPGTLLELEEHFCSFYKDEIITTEGLESGHGRVETRKLESIMNPLRFAETEKYRDLNKWANLQSIHKLTSSRYDKKKKVESLQVSYYISSLSNAEKVCKLIRNHWAIENNLHYCLDVILGEDRSLRRKDNAAKKVNIIYKIALFFLERLKSTSKRSFNALQKINALRKPSQILSSDF
ncbi:ISAs1 family transposase [Porphyromonas gingivalis]|uniref:ISAs1 family transposase n=1 Tax=Porphyromonas gingivalis TaxID=837 RepID=UPI000C1A7C95|nr:ISAs1 family transposase [Porphyromonas gingivalis]ATS02551.1 ISAs1 family transposase [Porphyromonas gingivalis]